MENKPSKVAQQLSIALQSHKFYHLQCAKIEKEIAVEIDKMTEEGKEPSKKDLKKIGKINLIGVFTKFTKLKVSSSGKKYLLNAN